MVFSIVEGLPLPVRWSLDAWQGSVFGRREIE